jgi:L-ascorbate metabolism protein UlaG (beta-lactamase superfamily)
MSCRGVTTAGAWLEVAMQETTFKWLGAAGFRVEHRGRVMLIDPYLTSRGADALPSQPLGPRDMADAELIFVSHGHFDHIADVPAVVEVSGASVFCSGVAADTLERKGVPARLINRLEGTESFDAGICGVRVFASEHIVFDMGLILRTAPRVLRPSNLGVLSHVTGMPSGPVMVYMFDFDGLSVVHMGSLGMLGEEARQKGIEHVDILMPPLQGHTHICSRAARLTAAISPRAVVPQHHDDFFPPVSQRVELLPFEAMVSGMVPGCRYFEPRMNVEFTAAEVLGEP